jgi:hypothetical protein
MRENFELFESLRTNTGAELHDKVSEIYWAGKHGFE